MCPLVSKNKNRNITIDIPVSRLFNVSVVVKILLLL